MKEVEYVYYDADNDRISIMSELASEVYEVIKDSDLMKDYTWIRICEL